MSNFFKALLYINLIVIEYLATTSQKIPLTEHIWDKAKHAFAFFVLYLLFTLAYKRLNTFTKAALLLLFGLQIEIVQYFLPYRDFSLFDILADCTGIILGIAAITFFKKFSIISA